MHISENENGVYKETTLRYTYEDAYTLEMKKFWGLVVEGNEVKTTAKDALQDLEVFEMIVRHGFGEGKEWVGKKGDELMSPFQ